MTRLSRLTPELRDALAAPHLAPSSALWAEAGRLGLASMRPTTTRPAGRWILTADGAEVRAALLGTVPA